MYNLNHEIELPYKTIFEIKNYTDHPYRYLSHNSRNSSKTGGLSIKLTMEVEIILTLPKGDWLLMVVSRSPPNGVFKGIYWRQNGDFLTLILICEDEYGLNKSEITYTNRKETDLITLSDFSIDVLTYEPESITAKNTNASNNLKKNIYVKRHQVDLTSDCEAKTILQFSDNESYWAQLSLKSIYRFCNTFCVDLSVRNDLILYIKDIKNAQDTWAAIQELPLDVELTLLSTNGDPIYRSTDNQSLLDDTHIKFLGYEPHKGNTSFSDLNGKLYFSYYHNDLSKAKSYICTVFGADVWSSSTLTTF